MGKRKGKMYMDYVIQSREHRFQPPNQNKPTLAKPGSIEKLRVLTERYGAGQPLHHPSDATCLDRRERAKDYLKMFHQRVSRP
jgi:hypothetical protein